MPTAIFPEQLQVDVGCGASREPVELVIRNGGLLPLTVVSAKATAGYRVMSELPLQILSMSSGALQVLPPEPLSTATLGDKSSGTLTFVTNEADSSNHEVQLNTTLFGGALEFTDGDGVPLNHALALSYLSSDTCPDNVKYRVRNTGNLAFTLLGPKFPAHFGGTSTGERGRSVPPDQYVEFEVSGNSMPGAVCSGDGELSFEVQGSFCGAVPRLAVTWPANVLTTGCACVAATEQ